MIFNYPSFDDVSSIKTGDMPGDKVNIENKHINNAKLIIQHLENHNMNEKTIISVHGGSGVGKSETASVLGHILNFNGLNTYILSGDNYPRRMPELNDQERIRVFREHALKGLVHSGSYTKENRDLIFDLYKNEEDCNFKYISEHSFMSDYITSGITGLKDYLGTPREIDFDEINDILSQFKQEASSLYLKRFGRTEMEFWYDEVDFTDVDVLILEWTHGNSKYLNGVDMTVLLNSTPEETLAHRKSRNRDGKVDSAFVQLVLALEQQLIFEQSEHVDLIITKSSEAINYSEYLKLMEVSDE